MSDNQIFPNYDNYMNRIVETIHHDNYTAYELVNDTMSGYYVNMRDKSTGRRIIIAKFPDYQLTKESAWFNACIFWDNLKIQNVK